MADIIQLLPDHVANQIAAGEVVQRPASVVKELLENAIDAKATQIKLLLKNSGKTRIQVIDNGVGMSATDARLCFERHATSKIKNAEDLFSLNTKGFRGEAMASIAAIAHVELKTRTQEDPLGHLIEIEGSKVTSQEVVAVPQGTSVSVKNLFFNIPARRNFLKSDAVELRHVMDEFHRVALAHPQIAFSMYHNDNDMFDLRTENFRQRIVHIFGSKINERLVPVNEDTELLKISGFVVKPEFSKKSRGEQFFFVNHRFIKSSYLNHAVIAAFEGLLPQQKIPSYFLNLEVDPKSIDINIHPTKTEIKFDDESTLYAIIRAAVKHSLGQFNIAPLLDFERDPNLDTAYDKQYARVSSPKVDVDPDFNPFKSNSNNVSSNIKNPSWEGLYVDLESKTNPNASFDFDQSIALESDPIESKIFDSNEETSSKTTFQLQHKYIISPIKSGLVVIDQHRAHERILYEDFLEQITLKSPDTQTLMFPLRLDFTKPEMAVLETLKVLLEESGFVIATFESDYLELSAIPVNIDSTLVFQILQQLISDVNNEVPDINFSHSDLMAKSFAKSLAIPPGKPLSVQEQEFIVNSLFACKEPNLSPSKQTVFITLSISDIDSKFS